MMTKKILSAGVRISAVLVLLLAAAAAAESVNWHGPSGTKIKEIRDFTKEKIESEAAPGIMAAPSETDGSVSNVIDSPPKDGFVPWIVLSATDESIDAETTGVYEAFPSSYIGSPPSGIDPRTDYIIGLFDTGASAHVIGYHNAQQAGLWSYKTDDNYVEVSGVTGSVQAHVTWPYGLFMSGLDVLEPNAPGEMEMVLPSTAGMLGEFNVATLIGPNPGANPDLATAIGTPMSVFYDTKIEVQNPVTVTHNGTEYTAPTITFYEKEDNAPGYPNYIPLELKPLGAVNVQYVTYGFDLNDLDNLFNNPFGFEFDYSPLTPSIVTGTASQSLFFIHGVDLSDNGQNAFDKTRFMLDTGAQVTVIGPRIAARLKLSPQNKDFEVDIEGVNGQSITVPGFYLDSLDIPAMGQWLEFTNVPVILLDISSPEGGKLDGIIGMNLFTQYNLMLRGGGFMLEDDPRLEFERIASMAADIAPQPGDGQVNLLDFSTMSTAWSANSPVADIAPPGSPDGTVDLQDLSVLADAWLMGTTP